MSERRRRLILIMIMAIVSLSIASIIVAMLYRTGYRQNLARLVETAQSQARLIEAVGRFDAVYSTDYPGGSTAATLSQLEDALYSFHGFAETLEFTLARRNDDMIDVLFRHRRESIVYPEDIPFNSELAEPMRLALSGKSGTIVGLDYRGETVIAAYEPVAELNLGIVAKMDRAEFRAPFMKTGIAALASSVLLILLGSLIFIHISEPMIKQLEDRVELLQDKNQAQEELDRFRRQYELILNTAGEGIYGLDIEGNTTFINPAAARLIGWEAEELIGKNQHQVLHHTKKDGTPYPPSKCPIYAAYKDGKIHKIDDEVFWRKDGSSFPVEYISTPIRGEQGRIEGAVVTFNDITDRKRAEEALSKSQQQMRLSIEKMHEAYALHEAIFDENGRMKDYRFLEFNPAAQAIAKLSLEDIIGKTALEMFPHVIERGLMDRYADVVETGQAIDIEDFYYSGDNLDLAFDISCYRIDRNHFVCIFRDITKQKQDEENLKKYSTKLEEMVEERTKELRETRDALVRQEKLAVLGQLAGGVGHELRNPLGVISNASYYLKTILPEAEENISEYLEIINSEVKNAEKIVADLFDFSRTRPVDRESVPVAELIDYTLSRKLLPGNIKVITNLPEDLPDTFVDRRQIEQVFENLMSNAVQAMHKEGEINITSGYEQDFIYVRVSDTGPGISDKTANKIFEPLFTTKARGIGLGLSVSRNLAEVNGGSLTFIQTEGDGAVFKVTLPSKEALR